MGRSITVTLLVLSVLGLTGCPIKDWVKRDESYLTVEQYKSMTEVIKINDKLYRVRKGEEINQNKITQLFYNLAQYKKTPLNHRKGALKSIKQAYNSEKSLFNTLTYVLILIETSGNESEALRALSGYRRTGMKTADKDLVNLSYILQTILSSTAKSKREFAQLTQKLDLVNEEVSYLNKQINALKNIEENIHAREVGIE